MKKVTLAGKKAGRRRWLAAATAAARALAEDWRSRFERDRIFEEILLPRQTEGPAGTDLDRLREGARAPAGAESTG